jgi:DNA-binding beta-propeller fold protein YncE
VYRVTQFVKGLWAVSLIFVFCHASLSTSPTAKIELVAGVGDGPLGGPVKGAQLFEPFGVVFDKQGNWYICEYKGHRITKVDREGKISSFAGTEKVAYSGDGGPANQASFNQPHGIVITKDQQMYVADTRNHCVRKIDLKTNRISTIAGTGQPGYAGDGGPADKATFKEAYAIDVNRAGDKLYIADLGNRRIRLVDLKSGVVKTIAGNGETGVPADGAEAVNGPLVDPRAVAVDSKGNIYILERRGNALRVVDAKGKIRTLIGPASATGDNTFAARSQAELKMNGPKHLCVDARDNVIIADSENHVILKYTPRDGKAVVIAGTGEKGSRLVADDPLRTQLNRPHGVFVHPTGALYISDSDNNRVLKMMNQ